MLLDQIKKKNYISALGEYKGNLLLVGALITTKKTSLTLV